MTAADRPHPSAPGPISRTPRTAWLALILALLITALAWVTVRGASTEAAHDRFSFQRAEAQSVIRARLSIYEQTLLSALGFLKASDDVTEEEWRIYVEGLALQDRFPGIQGVGYARWIDPRTVDAWVAEQRATGRPHFRIWPEEGRSEFTAIVFLEPQDGGNRQAIGYDMWTEAVRRAAMTTARDTGKPAITGRVQLVQDIGRKVQPGFLVYLPHYGRGPEPRSVEERRRRLEGFVYAPFRMRDFMAPITESELKNIRLRIYDGDGTDADRLLFDSHEDLPWSERSHLGLSAQTTLNLPGHVWTLRWTALESLGPEGDRWTPPLIIILGGLFSALSFSAVRNAAGLRLAEDNNMRLGRIIEEAASEVYVLDARNLRILQANRGARRNLGRGPDDLSDMTFLDIQTEIDRNRFAALTRSLRRGGDHVSYDTRHRRGDGSTYDVSVTVQLHPTSRPPVYHALVVDMTERRKAEAALNAALTESQALLSEKETLLKEIHHRVKNNLQVIWSLIRLEASDIQDAAVRSRLETVARRIGVLGEIHQQLYSSSSFSRIDIGEHLRRLGANLRALHAHRTVEIFIDADPLFCDIETAIPLGLIANELISNSLEHAFPDGRSGRVTATLQVRDGQTTFAVADDGIGFTGGERNGLGLRLVQALTRQLGGALETDGGAGGTRTRIVLPDTACAADTGPAPKGVQTAAE